MSEENVEVIRDMHEAFRAGDWDRALTVYREDAEVDMTRMPGGGIYQGPEGAREFYTRWIGAWERFEVDPLEVIDAGDTVVAILRISGTGRGSGAEVTMRAADVFQLEGGKAVRQVGYPDAAEALADLGLTSPGSS
jgi:ketosteroid isomerase-like protein